MTRGCVSDINGDDTVMDNPDATLSIDISKLDPQQALALAQAAGLDEQRDFIVGQLVKGEKVNEQYSKPAEFHIPIEAAITALIELGIIQNGPTGDTDGDE